MKTAQCVKSENENADSRMTPTDLYPGDGGVGVGVQTVANTVNIVQHNKIMANS